jgi:hypothetical protein
VSAIDKKSYVGYLLVGFLSLFGGISIFALVIVPDRKPESGVPRDVQVLFTEVFSNQSLIRSEMGRYTPALNQVGVDEDRCKRFSCLLTLSSDGLDYSFQLTKEQKTWLIDAKSPVPKEKK